MPGTYWMTTEKSIMVDVPPTNRGFHSFTSELNLSNSRPHSSVKLGDTVDRRAQVELKSERVYAPADQHAQRVEHDGLHEGDGEAQQEADGERHAPLGRVLHSSTFQLTRNRF
jgi:hypothetical protein